MTRDEARSLLSVDSERELAPEHPPGTFFLKGVYYKIMPKRWGILAIIAAIQIAELYTTMFFSFINDLVTAYFQTTPAMTDLLSTIYWASRAVFGPLVAMASQHFNQRFIALASSGMMCISYIMILIGISSRQNFYIVLIGQCLGGFSSALIIPLIQVLATNWFPKNEHGKVVSVQPMFRALSLITSDVVASQSLTLVYNKNHVLTVNLAHPSFNWVQRGFFIGFCVLTLAAYVSTLLFVTDHPPTLTPSEPESPSRLKPIWRPIEELKGIWNIVKQKKFVIMLLLNLFILSLVAFNIVVLSSVVIATIPGVNDKDVGAMFCTSQAVGLLGSATAAIVLDKFQKPKVTFLCGIAASVSFYIIIFLSLYYASFPGVFVGYVLLVTSRAYLRVCLVQRLVAVMYDKSKNDRFKAFVITGTLPYIVTPFVVFITRVIMTYLNPAYVYFFPALVVSIAGIMIWCLWDYISDTPKEKELE